MAQLPSHSRDRSNPIKTDHGAMFIRTNGARRNEATVARKTWAVGGSVCGSNPVFARPGTVVYRHATGVAVHFTRVYVITIDSNIFPSLMLGDHHRIVNSSLLLIS